MEQWSAEFDGRTVAREVRTNPDTSANAQILMRKLHEQVETNAEHVKDFIKSYRKAR